MANPMEVILQDDEVDKVLAEHQLTRDYVRSAEYGYGRHVNQIWDDGEITSQKAGPLLDQRTLHMMAPGIRSPEHTAVIWLPEGPEKEEWPREPRCAYITHDGALLIRMIILRKYIKLLQDELTTTESEYKAG